MSTKRNQQKTQIRNAIGRNQDSADLYIDMLNLIDSQIKLSSKDKVIHVIDRETRASKNWFKNQVDRKSFIDNPLFLECNIQYPGLYDGLYHIIGIFKVMNLSTDYIKTTLENFISTSFKLQEFLRKTNKLRYKDPIQTCGQMIVSSSNVSQLIDLFQAFDKDINIDYRDIEKDLKTKYKEDKEGFSQLSQGSLVNPYYLNILHLYNLQNMNLNAEPSLQYGLNVEKFTEVISGFIELESRRGDDKLLTQSLNIYEQLNSGKLSDQIYSQLTLEIINYISSNTSINPKYLEEELNLQRIESVEIITSFFMQKHYEDIFYSQGTKKLPHFTCIKLINEVAPKIISILLRKSNLLARGLKETKNKELNKSISRYERHNSMVHFESLLSLHIFSNPTSKDVIHGDMSNSNLYSKNLFNIIHAHYSSKDLKSFHMKSFQLVQSLLEDKTGLKENLKNILASL